MEDLPFSRRDLCRVDRHTFHVLVVYRSVSATDVSSPLVCLLPFVETFDFSASFEAVVADS